VKSHRLSFGGGEEPPSPNCSYVLSMQRLCQKILYFVYFNLMSLPYEFCVCLRRYILAKLLNQELEDLIVRPWVYIYGYRKLSIGKNVSINHNCFLSCDGGLEIGDNVSIAHGTSILTTQHSYDDPVIPIKEQTVKFLPVKIGDNVWIGAKVTILAGISIADGTIVGAGAVVTKSITEPDTIVAGVPARLIKKRF